MEIEYDIAKSEKNVQERGISFEHATEFEWDAATINIDTRRNYGETRYVATSYLYGRIHDICFTWRGDVARIISLSKANMREIRVYETETCDR